MTGRRIGRRRLGAGEIVHVSADQLAGMPAAFTWRGRRYQVRSVEAMASAATVVWPVSGLPRVYRVRTRQGLCVELAHDLDQDRWTMAAVLGSVGG